MYAADLTGESITVTGSITAADGTFTVKKEQAGNGDDYAEAKIKSKYDNYLIDLKAASGGGIEVKAKDGSNEKYNMAKLGTNGIIYSTKGLILGSVEENGGWTYANSTSATFYVNAENGNITSKGTLSVAGGNFNVDQNGVVTAKEKLILTSGNKSAFLDVDQVGKLSQLVNYSSGTKTKIRAADESTIGGVEFNGQKLSVSGSSGRSSEITITEMADVRYSTEGVKHFTTSASTGQAEGTWIENGALKVYKQKNSSSSNLVTIHEGDQNQVDIDTAKGIVVSHQGNGEAAKTASMNENGVFAGGTNYDEAKAGMSNVDGSLKAASGKFKVNADGSISAANNAFRVDDMGTVTGANDSKLGSVGFKDGKLYSTNDSAKDVAVSDLITDHSIVNNADYGNIGLDKRVQYIEIQTEGVKRVSKTVDGKDINGTVIENKLEVYEDGTVIINENEPQQVTIDSNGIKVGTGSAYINNDGFKAGADGKNSLTITGLTAREIRAGEDNTEFFVDGSGNVVAAGTLNAAGGKFDVSAEGNITASGSLSVAGDKFRVNENGSINANNKFIVGADGALRAADDKFTADKDGNVRAIGSLSAANDKFQVGTDGSINVNQKFIVNADGTLSAADGNFSVDADGKLISASGSQIGGVTIDGESLSYGTNSIKVSELASDHALVNDATKGNESLYNQIGNVQDFANGLDDRTGGIQRVSDPNDSTKHSTLIEGVFLVDNDGTARITNGFKAGTDDKNSLTTSGLKAKTIKAGTDNDAFIVDERGNVVAKGDLIVAGGEFYVGTDGDITTSSTLSVAGNNFTVDANGALTAADNKFSVDKDGAVKAANNDFSVDKDGKLISANGSKIGGVTIDGEKLSNGTKSITVSQLASDHALVNDINKGNENLYKGLSSVQTLANSLDTRTAGISRDTTGTAATTIEGKLKVSSDGTVSTVNGNFTVSADGSISSNGTLSVANGKFQIDASGVVTAGSVKMDNIDAADTSKGVTVGGVVLKDKTISAADDKFTVDADGALKAANNNFSVDKDGALKAANNNFSVDKDGKLISASGSQIGGVTIDGESLSNGTKSINVSELKDDHDLVNDTKKGNESLYTGLGSVQTLANSLDTRTAGISRDTTGTAATTIEGKLKVSSDGTVKINEGDAQQVIIDSNGIKVGTGSAYINNDGFKAGADGKNSLTTSGLTAKTIKTGTNNDAFVVDENGNVVANGALGVANGAFSVDISGNVITSGYVRLNSGANSTQLSAGGIKFIKDGTTTTIEGETVTVSSSGVKKSFNLSDIADVGQNMTSLGNRIDTVQKNVDAEAAARKKDVQDLNTAISKETTDRQQDVKNLNDALSKETTERQNDVKDLNDALSKETADRQQDVKNLNDALSKETADRQQDVKDLNDALSKETADRQQDVKNLNDALSKETTERQQDVKNLNDALSKETTERQNDVKRLDTAISDEAAARQKDVADLNGRVDTVNSRVDDVQKNVDAEAAARQKDVADLNGRVDTVNSRVDNISKDFNTAINDEKTKREQEVSRLDGRVDDVQKNVDAEAAARQKDVADLNGRVDTVNSRVDNLSNDFNTAMNDEKTKREQEVTRLDGRIDTVNTNLGDLNDLDGDLKARDEYTGNSSVVGGINAEAAARKEEVTRLDTAIADEAAARQADVARLDGRISDVSSRINKVGAMAAAISSLKTMGYDPESPTEFSIGLGQYKGETGVALGFFHYPNKNFMLNVSLSTSSGEIMGGIGATWRFGHKSPQKLLDEQREAQVKKEIAAAEAYKAARAARSKDAQ